MEDIDQALSKRRMWFGSYTRAGVLKKVQVWCFPHNGNIEFITDGESLKIKRASRNPHVVCSIGSEDGPTVEGTAEVIRERAEVWRGYHTYWQDHFAMMLILFLPLRRNINSGRQVMVRVHSDVPLAAPRSLRNPQL